MHGTEEVDWHWLKEVYGFKEVHGLEEVPEVEVRTEFQTA